MEGHVQLVGVSLVSMPHWGNKGTMYLVDMSPGPIQMSPSVHHGKLVSSGRSPRAHFAPRDSWAKVDRVRTLAQVSPRAMEGTQASMSLMAHVGIINE